jgi:hypothetical protein
MKLSEDLRKCKTDRPDEWTMDRFIRKAERLERQIQFLIETTDVDGQSYDNSIKVINQINN